MLAATSKFAPSSMQQLIKSDRSMFVASDDNALMKQIHGTHAPDGRDIELRPLLHLIEDILSRSTLQVEGIVPATQAHVESVEDRAQQASFISMLEALSFIIDRISCEMSCKCLGGTDAHATTVSLFNLLASYPWDVKLVLTLAAFALNYGEFWLLAQIYSSNPLAKSMAILKQVPYILEHSGPLKPRFDALNNLVKVILEVSRCIVAFRELPSMYITPDVPQLSTAVAHIPTAVYWTIKSVVACATQIISLTSMGHEYIASTTEAWELSSLAHKLKNILELLTNLYKSCMQLIEEKRNVETQKMLYELIYRTIHMDNMKVIKALLCGKDDVLTLLDGATKRRVSIEVLRRKNVLLLISGLDISHDELSILEQIHNESRVHATRLDSQYEVVWVPIVDPLIQWSDPLQKQFESLQSTMPWYSVHHPSLIDRAVISFIREEWHFRNKAILVVLDPQGKVACPNAIHMMWIWGSTAFPFTLAREEALWREETWRLELLVDGIDPIILNWIKEGKYIFLYGGEDIDWIRRFTKEARTVATAARIPLEMIYVGKSTKRDQVRRAISVINTEKLSHTWQDLSMVWFFWIRLESMLFSKIQQGRADEDDPMTHEIKRLLSFDKSGGWAVLSKGSPVVVNGHSSTLTQTLTEYDMWKEHVPTKGFDVAFRDYHQKLHGDSRPCCRFEFPSAAVKIPEGVKCPECLRLMEKFTTFICCHDQTAITAAETY